jgi:exonuclease VII small subunit
MSSTLLSQEAFQQALQHAQRVQEHGQRFEQIATSLERQGLSREQVNVLYLAGQQIREYGQSMSALVKQSLQNEHFALEDYILAQQQHSQAIVLYTQAIQILLGDP